MSNIYISNIESDSIENDNFRKVVATGPYSQVVLMSLLPGEDIGLETHDNVDQFFRFEEGTGEVIAGDEVLSVEDGFAVLIPAGIEHNVVNTGAEALKFYTIYSPANHIDGRVHATKADAVADVEDEEFGHK